MKTTKELWKRLTSTMQIKSVLYSQCCISIRYTVNGETKTATFPECKSTAELLVELGLITDYKVTANGLEMYRPTYPTEAIGKDGHFTMIESREPCNLSTIHISPSEAQYMATEYEYRQALQDAGLIARVVNMFSNNKKQIA
jgi:hypothetical protein